MTDIGLAIRIILHRVSIAQLAQELAQSRAKMYRVFAGEQSTDCLDENTMDDVVHNYPLPDFSFSDGGIPALIPDKLRHRRREMMQCLIDHYHHDPIEVDLYIQEIRTLINEGSSYDPDTQTVHVNNSLLEDAKIMLDELPKLKGIPGWKRKVCRRWSTFNKLTIDILQQEASEGFEDLPEVLFESIHFVHQLALDTQSSPIGSRQRKSFEYLLITGITQTTELLFLSRNEDYVRHMVKLVTKVFGKAAETPFKTLLIASAWSHTRPLMYGHFELRPFSTYQNQEAA